MNKVIIDLDWGVDNNAPKLDGYCDGEHWNGWSVPRMDLDNSLTMAIYSNHAFDDMAWSDAALESALPIMYDETHDRFIVYDYNADGYGDDPFYYIERDSNGLLTWSLGWCFTDSHNA